MNRSGFEERMIIFPKHLYRRCNCSMERCAICSWGAAICTRCAGIEGELPTDCPGEEMTDEQRISVLSGEINYHRRTGWIAEDVTRYARLRAIFGPGAPA
ncbi:hypothetical protein MPL3356_60588 [Mesorhizobium plurifarium]|uniref:Uncharacterized protein n=1 Tax=Mesorhizobium plurifarium TaxID=69974 RepID=A0A090EAA9_MESPL|nr:hypothetical protein MPL3356_60588 [Mesorhizobium plurifarium]